MKGLNKQLKKGVLEIVILQLIAKGDVYGYELIKELERSSKGYFLLKEGSLYPILYRLEDGDLIESYQKESAEKRRVPRKYYRITPAGLAELGQMKQEWRTFYQVVEDMLDGEED